MKFPEVQEGDQVKIRVRLKRSEFPEYRKIRSEILAEAEGTCGWQVCGIELLEMTTVRRRLDEPQVQDELAKTPEQYIRDYATAQKWREAEIKFGLKLLNP